jgi:hypothetical protein
MSRYANYQAFINDVSAEAGESEGVLDSLILNMLRSAVDEINLHRMECREATGTVTLAANDYDYTLSTHLSDFIEIADPRTAVWLSSNRGIFIPQAKTRAEFLEGWKPSSQIGTPTLWRLYAGVLWLRPTPGSSDTLNIEYYKRLTTPALAGSVLIPDEYLNLARGIILQRLENYDENEGAASKAMLLSEMASQVRKAIARDFQQRTLPSTVTVEEEW